MTPTPGKVVSTATLWAMISSKVWLLPNSKHTRIMLYRLHLHNRPNKGPKEVPNLHLLVVKVLNKDILILSPTISHSPKINTTAPRTTPVTVSHNPSLSIRLCSNQVPQALDPLLR